MSYKLLSIFESSEWNSLLSLLPDFQQDIYFTPEYYSLYENNGDGEAKCFVFKKGSEIALFPFLINSVNKLGYEFEDDFFDIQGVYGYNGVVASTYSKDFIKAFYKEYSGYCQNNNIIAEFVRFHPVLNNINFSKSYYHTFFNRKTVYVDTTLSKDELFKGFQTTTKKQIKRSINRHQIEVVKLSNDNTQLNMFLDIYWDTMDRVNSNKYLYFDEKYFRDLFLTPKTVQFIAKYKSKPIAMITALVGKKFLHGHLGGALTDYLNLSAYSLLYWEMIKYAIESGKDYLHVGGGATTSKEDSLFKFKQNFSSLSSDFYIGKKIHNEKIYKKVVCQWKNKFPVSYENNKNMVLGYREIK